MRTNKGRWKKSASVLMAGILMVVCALPADAAGNYTYGQYVAGSTSEEMLAEEAYTVITISTEEELRQLAEDCQLDSWSRDKYVRLAGDIVLQETKDIMIPSFGGIFDGCGHKIENLEILDAGSAVGLFRYIQESGIVRNLSVSGRVFPNGSKSQAGILAGVNYGTILKCNVSGEVSGTEAIGGVAGVNEAAGEIRICQSTAVVTGEHYTGGICGVNNGTLNNCGNSGGINTFSPEVTYSLEDITIESLEDINDAGSVLAHMDTGGIAGYSQGKIYYCANTGTVGYQHVGYNVGGIVGRLHQGYLQNCTNVGHVLGRKDVGGIAGQLEPFLEIQYLNDKLDEIEKEVDKFMDILELTHNDLSGYSAEAVSLTRRISDSLNLASGAAGELTSATNDLWYIYNQELAGINNDLDRLNQEMGDIAEADREKAEQEKADREKAEKEKAEKEKAEKEKAEKEKADKENADKGNGVQEDNQENNNENTGSGLEINGGSDQNGTSQGSTNQDGASQGSTNQDGTSQGSTNQDGTSQGNTNQDGASQGSTNQDGTGQEKPDVSITVNGNEVVLPDHIGNGGQDPDWGIKIDVESYIAALRRFGDNTSNHLSNVTTATNDISGGINENLATLNRELQSAGDSLSELTDVLTRGTEATTANLDALAEQTKVLRNSIKELRDDLFRYEGISVEDASDEEASGELEGLGAAYVGEAYYDTSAFQQGKITLCLNEGLIEADTNVGGIAGQVATEFDFDPEEDIQISGAESFNIEQTVKAIIRESRNGGDVVGKKNYVGGVVGKADFGAVISCESYGDVSSTGGSYVGGITGASGYCIRSCYYMGMLSGKDYVGGIAGRGSDIFYCYAYPELEYTGEYVGSIAGQLEEEGMICENYYVRGNVAGVDSIGYDGGATPLSYPEFCSKEGIPEAFEQFTVSFRVDGSEIASFQCHYGEAIDRALIPEVPEKDGCYGLWPEFDFDCVTGNRVLEAEYEQWISSLASEEKDEQGRTRVLARGEFLPGAELVLSDVQGGTEVRIIYRDENGAITEEYTAPLVVRVSCDDTENAIPEVWKENAYVPVSAEVMGSYLEFTLEQSGIFRITIPEKEDRTGIIMIAAGVGLLLVLVLVLKAIVQHRKKKQEQNSK